MLNNLEKDFLIQKTYDKAEIFLQQQLYHIKRSQYVFYVLNLSKILDDFCQESNITDFDFCPYTLDEVFTYKIYATFFQNKKAIAKNNFIENKLNEFNSFFQIEFASNELQKIISSDEVKRITFNFNSNFKEKFLNFMLHPDIVVYLNTTYLEQILPINPALSELNKI